MGSEKETPFMFGHGLALCRAPCYQVSCPVCPVISQAGVRKLARVPPSPRWSSHRSLTTTYASIWLEKEEKDKTFRDTRDMLHSRLRKYPYLPSRSLSNNHPSVEASVCLCQQRTFIAVAINKHTVYSCTAYLKPLITFQE